MKKKTRNKIITVVIIIVILGGIVWLFSFGDSKSETKIISRNGLHWHATLKILIDGKPFQIPANIGIGMIHNPIHTHENDQVIHLEFERLVTEENVILGKFFDVWNKTLSSQCVLDKCVGPENPYKKLTMTVNGAPNNKFGNYVMQDGDEIEIKYE